MDEKPKEPKREKIAEEKAPPRKISLEEWAEQAGLDIVAKAAMRANFRPTERRTATEWLILYERMRENEIRDHTSDGFLKLR